MKKAIKAFFFGLALLLPSFVSAGTEHNMAGYAWSSNIGWISFNCTNDNSCATADYGVNQNSDGTLAGYAWSSTLGWIKFGSLSGFPSGNGTQSSNAQVNGNNLQGWARVCSGMGDTPSDPSYPNQSVTNDTCTGVSRTDGWDGWISLSGASYGVNTNGTYSGYAWGGSVVGWVMFDPQSAGVCVNCGVNLSSDASLDVQSGGSSIVGQGAVTYGTIPTFLWTLKNLPSGATCAVSKVSSGGTAFAGVNGITSSGSTTGNALTSGAYTYQISCSGGGMTALNKQVSFTVAPQPAGFSLGSDDTARIQFLNSGSADSEQRAIYVSTVGGFTSPVTISISGFPTPPNASTTFSYSLGGSAFSSSPTPVTVTSSNGVYPAVLFKMRISRPVDTSYTVNFTGSSSGYPSSQKNITVTPTVFNPAFKEF